MLMIVMSLAISLAPIHAFCSYPWQENNANRSNPLQQMSKDATAPTLSSTIHPSLALTSVALPLGANAWALQIDSRGGLTGSGRGDLTLTSDGLLTWSAADGACSRMLSDETMHALTMIVLAADASTTASEKSLSILCGDCYTNSMILQHRETDGAIRTSSARWDDVSQAKVSAAMITVYETMMAFKGCSF
jgi:hypothetical protein